MDAGAILLFVLGLTGLAIHLRSFAKQLDVSTLEASDYTVVVRGLPPGVDAAQVGAPRATEHSPGGTGFQTCVPYQAVWLHTRVFSTSLRGHPHVCQCS